MTREKALLRHFSPTSILPSSCRYRQQKFAAISNAVKPPFATCFARRSLVGSLVLQFIATILQNMGRGVGPVLYELLFICLGLKSPRDAYRVVHEMKQEKGAMVDSLTELTVRAGEERSDESAVSYSSLRLSAVAFSSQVFKVLGLFAEGLPAVAIQVLCMLDLLERGETGDPLDLLVSLTTSVIFSGFSVAQIDYEWDTDPKKRAQKPDFYGYVPDGGKAQRVVFASLVIHCCVMLVIKSLGLVVLFRLKVAYMATYLAIDNTFYLFIKIIRGDFLHWLPLKGATHVVVSLLLRVINKTVSDFTGGMVFRHAREVGGAQWLFSQLNSIATLLVALHLAEKQNKYGNFIASLWRIGFVLSGSALLSFGIFLSYINERYFYTFFSLETGGQMTIRVFRSQEDDESKAVIFKRSETQWQGIRDEVKEWVWLGWPRWMEEKPIWFNERMRSRIPVDMIPSLEDQRQQAIAAKGRDKKKYSHQPGISVGRRRALQGSSGRSSFLSARRRSAIDSLRRRSSTHSSYMMGQLQQDRKPTKIFPMPEEAENLSSEEDLERILLL